jgi:hypothetical protein
MFFLFDLFHLLQEFFCLSLLLGFLSLNSVLEGLFKLLLFLLLEQLQLFFLIFLYELHGLVDSVSHITVWRYSSDFDVFDLTRCEVFAKFFEPFPPGVGKLDKPFGLCFVLVVDNFQVFGLTGVLGFDDLDKLALHVVAVFHDNLLRVGLVFLNFFLVGD